EIIRDLKTRGYSILITDHQWRETSEITDRIYLIAKGKVVCDGPPQDVMDHPTARELYFGNVGEVSAPAVPPPHAPRATPQSAMARPSSSPLSARSVHEEETLSLDD